MKKVEISRACRVLVRKHEQMKPLGRPRHRWEDNTKTDFQDLVWGRGAWTSSIWFWIGTGDVVF